MRAGKYGIIDCTAVLAHLTGVMRSKVVDIMVDNERDDAVVVVFFFFFFCATFVFNVVVVKCRFCR